jgi:hypothetical protein
MSGPALTARRVETRSGPIPRGEAWEALVSEIGRCCSRAPLRTGRSSGPGCPPTRRQPRCSSAGWAGQPVVVYRGAPEIEGRFAYTPQVDGFNFAASREPLDAVLGEILASRSDPCGAVDLRRLDRPRDLFPRARRGGAARPCRDPPDACRASVARLGLAWQPDDGDLPLRRHAQHRRVRGRAAAFHAVSARAGWPISTRVRSSRRRAARSSRWSTWRRPTSNGTRVSPTRWNRRKWPKWSRATCSSTRRCGGTTSKRWRSSTCW